MDYVPPGESFRASTPPAPPVPPAPPTFSGPIIKPPTPEQQSVGTIISIIIIVLMIIIGAFYSWGARIAQNQSLIQNSAIPATY